MDWKTWLPILVPLWAAAIGYLLKMVHGYLLKVERQVSVLDSLVAELELTREKCDPYVDLLVGHRAQISAAVAKNQSYFPYSAIPTLKNIAFENCRTEIDFLSQVTTKLLFETYMLDDLLNVCVADFRSPEFIGLDHGRKLMAIDLVGELAIKLREKSRDLIINLTAERLHHDRLKRLRQATLVTGPAPNAATAAK